MDDHDQFRVSNGKQIQFFFWKFSSIFEPKLVNNLRFGVLCKMLNLNWSNFLGLI